MTSKSYLDFAASTGRWDLVALQVQYKASGFREGKKTKWLEKEESEITNVKKVKVNGWHCNILCAQMNW